MKARKATAVDAHFDADGTITPRSFSWHRGKLTVEGVGRRWEEGAERCFLVLATGQRPFELRFDSRTLRWHVTYAPSSRRVV